MPEAVLMPAPTMKATFLLRATWRARLWSSDSPTELAGSATMLLDDANAGPGASPAPLPLPVLLGASSWIVRIAILAAGRGTGGAAAGPARTVPVRSSMLLLLLLLLSCSSCLVVCV